MDMLRKNGYVFLVRESSLFVSIFLLILAVGLWFTKFSITGPINAIAFSAKAFAENLGDSSEDNVERIRRLNITTGDEIENLYHAFLKMSEDSTRYVSDIETQGEKIRQTQNALIMVLADMVESRDKNTGDHVRKTAAYVEIIMEEMKKEGIYADKLTDEFVSNVIRSAPLHDVGKIQVPDAILNKPGKLTDEEFNVIKEHAYYTYVLLQDIRGFDQIAHWAALHHEKLNGTGYPFRLSGADIPLGSRIMAVADVFDALVSERVYKKPIAPEAALDLIESESGSHFDPAVIRVVHEMRGELAAAARAELAS